MFFLVSYISIFFGEMCIQLLCLLFIGLFVFLLLNCKNSLFIQDTRALSDIWFAGIFSCSCSSTVFLLSWGAFEVQSFSFDEFQFVPFLILFLVLFTSFLKTTAKFKITRNLALYYFSIQFSCILKFYSSKYYWLPTRCKELLEFQGKLDITGPNIRMDFT